MCSGRTLIPFPLFCQVGCQNLTGSSTFSAQHHCVLALLHFFFALKEDVLSKVNIRSGSWIRRNTAGCTKKKKWPQPYVEYKWRCTGKICSVANSILLSRHPVCAPSCSPNAKCASWIHGRKTETRAEEEAHAAILSCLMVSLGKRARFTQKISNSCHFAICTDV